MRTLLPISLADLADAVRRLSPDEKAFELIAGVLGFRIEANDADDNKINPSLFSRDAGDRAETETEVPDLTRNKNVPPDLSDKELDVEQEGDSDGTIVVETFYSAHSREVPAYIQQSEPLNYSAFSLPPATKPRPLLPRHQARSFVWEMLAQDLPSTEIDCDAIIDQLSSGLIPELRVLNKKSVRNAVHLLVDESPAMLPYSNDAIDLQHSIRNILGQSLTGDFSFDELPDRGVESAAGEELLRYPFPNTETTILLVSDLGVAQPFGYQTVSTNEWAGFLKRLVRSGFRVIVVSPYGQNRLTKLISRGVSIVHWGTKHYSHKKVSVQDFARLLSPAALLDIAFLREVRIKFFPEAPPGLEAELLFSWMVAAFNTRVVSLRQETVRELREELMNKPFELEKALDFLKKYRGKNDSQSQLPDRVAFEEQLVTDVLTQNSSNVEQAFARLIRSLIEDDMNPKLARWAIAVADELPRSVSDVPLSRDLKLAAQLRLGIISEDFNTPDRENASVGNRSWLLPKDVKLGIRRENGKLVITDSPQDKDVTIQVPGTVPRHLIVAPVGKPRMSVQIWPGRQNIILPFRFPIDIFSPLSGLSYRLKLMKLPAASSGVSGFRRSPTKFTASGGKFNPERFKPVSAEFPPDELLIFIGHSDDASAEANAIRELQSEIEKDFRLLLKSTGHRSLFRRIRLWEWTFDALALLGDQERAVTPALDRAQITIFVFRERVGTVTWQELEKARKGNREINHYILAFFPETSPFQAKYPNAQAKLQVARDWTTLLERQEELTKDWTNLESCSVTPSLYQDTEHLKTIVRDKVRIAIADILSVDITHPTDGMVSNAEELHRYQGALKTELGTISLLGTYALENIPVTLTDTFVSLRISDTWRSDMRWNPKVFYESQQEERIRNPEELVSLVFETCRLLLVIGDPGSGKTTLLKHYAFSCLENEHYTTLGFKEPVLVFYLPLRELVKKGADFDTLPANLFAWSEKHLLGIAETLFFDWLHNRQTLLLLDGLDEISGTQQRIKACDWIDRIVIGFEKAKVVVTTRYTGYRKGDGIELRSRHVRADIMDFSPDQQKEFLEKWFRSVLCRELRPATKTLQDWREEQSKKAAEKAATIISFLEREENQSLRMLAAVPMLLQMMAILWKDRHYLPKTRSELYHAAVNYFLDYRDRQKEIYPLLSAEDALRVLTPVSLWMQEELEKDEADKVLMQKEMQTHLKTLHNPPAVEKFCENLIDRAGLLVAYGDNEYRFRHKSFREYMAGLQLEKKMHSSTGHLDKLVQHFGKDWWEEPLRFYIAEVDADAFDAFMGKLFDAEISATLNQKQQDLLVTLIKEARQIKTDALKKKLLDPATTINRQGYLLECLKVIGTPAALDVLYQFILMIRTKYIDTAIRVEDIIISMGGKIPAPDLDDESTYNEIPVKYVHHTDSRLKNEVFAIELLKNNIYLQKKENGRITVIIDRNDVQNAVITSRAKGNICKKFITENNKKQLVQKDKEIHDFLSETINNKKQYEINLSQLKIPLRLASGGVFSVVRYKGKTWTPFFFRDISPFGWNISLGASERHFSKDGKSLNNLSRELNDPWKFIAREFLEETLVLNREPAVTKEQIAKKFTFGITDIRQQRENALKLINAHIECRKKYDNLRVVTTQEKLDPANYDVRTRLQATNTDLIIRHGGEDTFHDDVLVCFNLLELGIEIVKIAEYDLADTDYLLDGEILEHYDGNSKLIQELVRMPFALISHSYLEDTFGGDFEPNYTMDTAQPSIIGKPIQSEDIHIFDWDVIQRVKILKGDLDDIGIEKKRYEGWYKQFKQYFLDDNDNPTTENPSSLFTPASAKIVNTYFTNKKRKIF